jgi:hypothetical protein
MQGGPSVDDDRWPRPRSGQGRRRRGDPVHARARESNGRLLDRGSPPTPGAVPEAFTMKFTRGGLHVRALISGDRDVKQVCAHVTTASARTVVSPRLASRVAETIGGMTACTTSPSIGRRCGPMARVDVVVDGCRAASVQAVVAPLPRGLELAIGRTSSTRARRGAASCRWLPRGGVQRGPDSDRRTD